MTDKSQSLNGQLCAIVDELARHGIPLNQARREFEKLFIIASLRHHHGNLGRSAKALGVHRNTLRNKVSTLNIDPADYSRRSGGLRPRRTESLT